MLRLARLAFCGLLALVVLGCQTSEIKNNNPVGLVEGTPTGSVNSGYGDGKGDSVGGGGAAKPYNAEAGK